MDDWRVAGSRHMVTNLAMAPRARDLLWIALVNIPLNCITMHSTDLKRRRINCLDSARNFQKKTPKNEERVAFNLVLEKIGI